MEVVIMLVQIQLHLSGDIQFRPIYSFSANITRYCQNL